VCRWSAIERLENLSSLILEAQDVQDENLKQYDATSEINPIKPQATSSALDLAKATIEETPAYLWGKAISNFQNRVVFGENSPKVNGFEKWKQAQLPDKYFDDAIEIENQVEWDQFISRVAETENRNKIFNDYGLTGTALKFTANVAGDPTTYATFGTGMMLKAGAAPVKAYAASGAAAGAAVSLSQEIGSPEENNAFTTTANIAGGAVIGGLLGKGVETWSTLATKNIIPQKDFYSFSNESLTKAANPAQLTAQDLSAMAAKTDDYRIGGNIVSRSLNKALSLISPRARGQAAVDAETANLYGKVLGTSARTKSNIEDQIASGINFGEEVNKLRQQSLAKSRSLGEKLQSLQKSGYVVKEQDYKDAAIALWSNKGLSDAANPAVKAIYEFADEFKNLRKTMEDEGVKDFVARNDYGLPVIINKEKANQNLDALVSKNLETLKKQRESADEIIAKLEGRLEKINAKLKENKSVGKIGITLDKLAKNAQDIEDDIAMLKILKHTSDNDLLEEAGVIATSYANGSMQDAALLASGGKKLKPKFFRERNIDPIEYIDFLETNPALLLNHYINEVSPAIAINRAFPQKTIDDVLQEYAESMDAKIAKAKTSKDDRLASKLENEKKSALRDISTAWATETGTYSAEAVSKVGIYAPFLNALSNFTNITKLGGQVMSSVSEVAAITLHHGLGDAGIGVSKLIKSFVSDPSMASVAKKEAGYFGVGLEVAQNKILMDMMGHEVLHAEIGGKAGRALQKGNAMMQRLNLSVYYDSVVRTAGFLVQQGVIKERLLKFGSLSKDELSDLAYLGIDKNNYRKIIEQLKKHGTEEKGIFLSNADQWDDAVAREIWVNAIRRDNRRTSVQADLGDTPFIFRTPIGKNFFKFKTWSVAATQKYLLQASQRPTKSLPAIGMIVGFSSAVDYFYNKSQGKDVSTDPDELLWAGINRSGILGVLPEAGGSVLVNRLAGIQSGGARIYEYSDVKDVMAGVTGSVIADFFRLAPVPKLDEKAGEYKMPYFDKNGNLKEGPINSLVNLLPIPLVKPYLKEYAVKPLVEN